MAALAGLGYWGYRTDWSLAGAKALLSGDASSADLCPVAGGEGWCKEHNIASAECIECNSELLPKEKDYGWCAEHGIAQCPLHHPDVAQLKTEPVITPADMERAARALALLPRHTNGSQCKHYLQRIQFASLATMEKAGVDIAVVGRRPMIEAVAANGEVIYDQTRTAHLASRVPGTVWSVETQVGRTVRKGDVFALVDSADVGKAKGEFLKAIADLRLRQANVERIRPLAVTGAAPGKQLREAEAAFEEAKIRLRSAQQALVNLGLPVQAEEFAHLDTDKIADEIQFLGLPEEVRQGLPSGATTSNLFPLRAPLDGVVVDCKVVPGEVVDTNEVIFTVSDVNRMWLELDVRQEDVSHVSLGQTVRFRPTHAQAEAESIGSIAWISTESDDKTRTVKVRVELPNSDRKLRANTFGTGRIVLREEPQAIVVPSEAVHTDGDCMIVFVRDKDFLREGSPKFFHIREVRLGVRDGEMTEIIAGVLPGEVIASKNSMVLEAQLMKSNLGAGCACCVGVKK
jgi:cobalt-zinc-cadmium efflux system membrane fusion protein